MIMVADGITQGNFETTQDVRSFDHGHAAVVEVAGATVGRVTFEPGWQWSKHLRPMVGTDSCRCCTPGSCSAGACTSGWMMGARRRLARARRC